MALKQLILNKRISGLNSQLEELREKDADFTTRAEAMKTREAELEAAVNELTDEATEEEKTTVDEAVAAFEADQEILSTEQAEIEESKKVAASIKILSEAALVFAGMTWEDLGKAGASIVVLLAALAGFTHIVKPANLKSTGLALIEVAFALNHSSAHKVTEGYIQKDYSPISKLNDMVLSRVFDL